jgi:hypothetical protein
MADLTPEGQRIVEEIARRYSMSTDAVRATLEALVASDGGMAQFNHPDLGGMGQWSSGGMLLTSRQVRRHSYCTFPKPVLRLGHETRWTRF